MTWNVQHARRPDGVVDIEVFVATCASFDADVLALQEVDRRTARVGGADLLAAAEEATGLVAIDGAVSDFDGGTYGNALLLRAAPTASTVSGLPRPWWPPWHRPERRGLVVVELDGLTVAACHLGTRRREARRQLRAALTLVPATGPAVLIGDFNLRPEAVVPIAAAAGFHAAAVPAAFPAHAPEAAIDHVLVRGIHVVAGPSAERPAVSDHRPVVVDLSFFVA